MTDKPKLAAENAHTFWNGVWENSQTGWRGGEAVQPFFRNLYVFLASLDATRAPGVPSLPHDVRALGDESGSLFRGEVERAVVRDFVAGKAVLVPLCGDTAAVPFFVSQGAAVVVGADLSAQALAAQMAANFQGVAFASRVVCDGAAAADRVTLHEATVAGTVVRLFEGDLLKLPGVAAFAEQRADFVYDRASFMAMSPALRGAYVHVVAGQLTPVAPLLVERPVRVAGDLHGPPFTFSNEMLKELYEAETKRSYDVQTILQYVWGEPKEGGPLHFEFVTMKPTVQ